MRAKTKKEKYQKIMEKKIATTPDELCKNYSEEFVIYFQYCRGLQFEEKPDYNYIRALFKNIFEKYNYIHDFKYDWTLIKKANENEEKHESTKITNDGNNAITDTTNNNINTNQLLGVQKV